MRHLRYVFQLLRSLLNLSLVNYLFAILARRKCVCYVVFIGVTATINFC